MKCSFIKLVTRIKKSVGSLIIRNYTFEKRTGGVLVSRITSPYPGANHVAPPAT